MGHGEPQTADARLAVHLARHDGDAIEHDTLIFPADSIRSTPPAGRDPRRRTTRNRAVDQPADPPDRQLPGVSGAVLLTCHAMAHPTPVSESGWPSTMLGERDVAQLG